MITKRKTGSTNTTIVISGRDDLCIFTDGGSYHGFHREIDEGMTMI